MALRKEDNERFDRFRVKAIERVDRWLKMRALRKKLAIARGYGASEGTIARIAAKHLRAERAVDFKVS